MKAAFIGYLYGGLVKKVEKLIDSRINTNTQDPEEKEDVALKMPFSMAPQMIMDLCLAIRRGHVLVAMNHIGMLSTSRAGQLQCYILWRAAEHYSNFRVRKLVLLTLVFTNRQRSHLS